MADPTDPRYPDTARVLRLAEDRVERDACAVGAEIRRTGRKRNITLVAAEEATFGEKLDGRRKALTAWSHAVPPHDWALAEESHRAALLATALTHTAELLVADGLPPSTPFLGLGRDTVADYLELPVLPLYFEAGDLVAKIRQSRGSVPPALESALRAIESAREQLRLAHLAVLKLADESEAAMDARRIARAESDAALALLVSRTKTKPALYLSWLAPLLDVPEPLQPIAAVLLFLWEGVWRVVDSDWAKKKMPSAMGRRAVLALATAALVSAAGVGTMRAMHGHSGAARRGAGVRR